MKPSAYKHIAAWCKHYDHPPQVRRNRQRKAALDSAPVDAVYHLQDASGGHWVTYAECGVQTRMTLDRMLNKGVTSHD